MALFLSARVNFKVKKCVRAKGGWRFCIQKGFLKLRVPSLTVLSKKRIVSVVCKLRTQFQISMPSLLPLSSFPVENRRYLGNVMREVLQNKTRPGRIRR